MFRISHVNPRNVSMMKTLLESYDLVSQAFILCHRFSLPKIFLHVEYLCIITQHQLKVFNHSFIHSAMTLQPFVGPWPLLQFRNHFYTDGRTPWTSDQPVTRPLPTQGTTHTQNKRTHQTSMPWVGFKPTILAPERAKTVYALDRTATVIGC
jgi:hypothetical protein